MLGPGVYFATRIQHTEFKANYKGAYICAKVNVGTVQKTTRRADPRDPSCDTVYYKHPQGSDEFCVKDQQRIEELIIVLNQDDSVRRAAGNEREEIKDRFCGETYTGCIY